MQPAAPTPNSPATDSKPGERALAFIALVAGVLLAVLAYSPRFTSKPIDYHPGEVAAYRVDINRADRFELMQVPGIGPGKADAIVAHRDAVGGFGTINDLNGVKGIGPKTIDHIKPHVLVDNPSTPSLPSSPSQGKLKPGDPPLDINAATEADLQRLPGIGPAMSARIFAAKPFKSIEDLRRVKGIGAKTLENLRPFIAIK